MALAGCASAPPITPAGNGTYLVSRQAATGFGGMGDLRAGALREAGAFCEGQRKSLDVVDTRESQPPYMMGNYPRVDIQFRCT